MSENQPLSAHTRRVVFALIFGAVLPLLDISIVNVAIRPLATIFTAPIAQVQWVITSYGLASALAIPVSGWATARTGATRVWRFAIIAFTFTSLACALAPSLGWLVAARSAQGFAAGLSMPVLQTLLITSAGKSQATRAMTAVGLPAVIAPVVGPLLGGVLLQAFTWHAIFLVNVPIGVIAYLAAVRILPHTSTGSKVGFDFAGFALISPAMVLAVWALTRDDLASGALLPLVGLGMAFTLFGAFYAYSRAGHTRLLNVEIFRFIPQISAGISLLLASVVFYGGLFLIPLYYQSCYHYSPLLAGVLLTALGVGAWVGRSATNHLTVALGTRRTALIAITCIVLGTFPFALPPYREAAWIALQCIALVVRGAGVGALTMLTMAGLYHQLEVRDIVHASTASRIATQLGSALGVTACAFFLALTGGIGPGVFALLSALSAILAVSVAGLPRGEIIRK